VLLLCAFRNRGVRTTALIQRRGRSAARIPRSAAQKLSRERASSSANDANGGLFGRGKSSRPEANGRAASSLRFTLALVNTFQRLPWPLIVLLLCAFRNRGVRTTALMLWRVIWLRRRRQERCETSECERRTFRVAESERSSSAPPPAVHAGARQHVSTSAVAAHRASPLRVPQSLFGFGGGDKSAAKPRNASGGPSASLNQSGRSHATIAERAEETLVASAEAK
jgi:hypothetical protein